ncbi:MAG: hypothetical protein WC653_00005 [Candidatus Gracilibacteria bacterium]
MTEAETGSQDQSEAGKPKALLNFLRSPRGVATGIGIALLAAAVVLERDVDDVAKDAQWAVASSLVPCGARFDGTPNIETDGALTFASTQGLVASSGAGMDINCLIGRNPEREDSIRLFSLPEGRDCSVVTMVNTRECDGDDCHVQNASITTSIDCTPELFDREEEAAVTSAQ